MGKFILAKAVILTSLLIHGNVETYQKPLTVQEIVQQSADKYHVSSKTMMKIIECEDPTLEPTQQSNIYRNGIREESYGIAQINIPSWEGITIKQATDPQFSADFMAQHIASGDIHIWSCAKKLNMM